MVIFEAAVFIGLAIFTIVIIHNIILISKEKLGRVTFEKTANGYDYDYKKAAKWLKKAIGYYSNDTAYIIAGEFNYKLYNQLLDEELLKIVKEKNLKLVAIGGPYISIPASGEKNNIVEWAEKGNLALYLRKDQKRTLGHGLVAKKSNSLCLLEDPHEEFAESDLTVFYNSFDYCNALREKASALMSDSVSKRIDDFSSKSMEKYLKTEDKIRANGYKLHNDPRVKNDKLDKPAENELLERRRLQCLAHTV